MRWSSFEWWTSYVDHIYYMIHARPFGLQCSEAMSVHARLVKFNPSILRVQNWLTPVVFEGRAYHTRSSCGASARRTFATVHTEGEHLYLKILVRIVLRCYRCSRKNKTHKKINITCNQNRHDMAIIILCIWSPSPKHRHDLHRHRLDTMVFIVASWSSRQLLLLLLSLTHSDKVNQLHDVHISYNKETTIRLLPVVDNLQNMIISYNNI